MEDQLKFDSTLDKCITLSIELANKMKHWMVTPEHILYVIVMLPKMQKIMHLYSNIGNEPNASLSIYLKEDLPILDEAEELSEELEFIPSNEFQNVLKNAAECAFSASRKEINILHWLRGLLQTDGSYGSELLNSILENRTGKFIASCIEAVNADESLGVDELTSEILMENIETTKDYLSDTGYTDEEIEEHNRELSEGWKKHVVCINDIINNRNPLIGREKELERTLQVLCRKDKNNPLHIGEPGVGKTALIYGLARMIEEGKVPERLRNTKIYQMDMGSMVAGTQYRGDFEEKIRSVLSGASKEGNAIIYIDEIHTMMGAGSVGEGSLDASNMLKQYLEDDKIRFIGSTTFDEFKRSVAKDKAITRRFQEISIDEPSEEEAIKIVLQLISYYADYHGVLYVPGAAEFAVKMSKRHIHGRFLPDKAIDLIDEAGAFRELHHSEDGEKTVTTDLIAEVLARICKVDALAMKTEAREYSLTLAERLLQHVYGQDKVVRSVAESVLMSHAGLTAEHKPIGSFLFVGPTGVGKTELARTLSKEMGIGLVRFDMSEYVEKHTVAKLIGSPAGYVGYEDGGLLTDAIRKTPNCVLLLDELEKAHPDIYNILLQVMDYATLTDNQGRTADFSNVILIMTSNAGAQFASQSKVGFGNSVSSGEAMMKDVKRTFKPEFLNRLTGIEIFNDMDRDMARLILNKALRELDEMLLRKNIELELKDNAKEWLLDKGFSREYGARELERTITAHLKKPLSHEILFGNLVSGGKITVDVENDKLRLIPEI